MPTEEIWLKVRGRATAEREMNQAHQAAKRAESSTGKGHREAANNVNALTRSYGRLKSMIGYGLGALGVGGVVFGLKHVMDTTKSLAKETEEFHSISGIGAQTSLYYTAALKARGIGAQAGGKAFKFLAKNMETAERQQYTYGLAQASATKQGKTSTTLLGKQAKAFQDLGINLQSFNQLTEQDKFKLITERFEGMTAGVQKTRIATLLFGKGGTSLLPVLEKNNLSLNHQIKLVEKYFPKLGHGEQALERYREKQAELNMAVEGFEFTLGMELVPTLTDVMEWISNLIYEIEHGNGIWGELGDIVKWVVGAVKDAVKWFEKHYWATRALVIIVTTLVAAFKFEKIVKFTKAVKALTVAQWALSAATYAAKGSVQLFQLALATGPIGLIIGAVVILIATFTILYLKVRAFRDAVNSVLSWVAAHWKTILPIMTGPIGQVVVFFVDAFKAIRKAVEGDFTALASIVKSVFENIVKGILAPVNGLIKALDLIIEAYNHIPSFLRPTDKIPTIPEIEPFGGPSKPKNQQQKRQWHAPMAPGVNPETVGAAAGTGVSQAGQVGGQPIQIENKLYVDRRQVARPFAEAITEYTLKKQARE